jgi:putative acetyltransferase
VTRDGAAPGSSYELPALDTGTSTPVSGITTVRLARGEGRPFVNVLVRRAEPRDAPSLVELALEVGSEVPGWLISAGEWRSATEERRYLRSIRGHEHAAVFVAENSEGIVGRLSIARDPHPASAHVADLGLMVRRDRRREGVGTALMNAAEEWARGAGVLKLELHVFPHNEPALRLYRKLGYAQEGFRHRHYRREAEFLDAVLMAKELEGSG